MKSIYLNPNCSKCGGQLIPWLLVDVAGLGKTKAITGFQLERIKLFCGKCEKEFKI